MIDWPDIFPHVDEHLLALGGSQFDRVSALLPDLTWSQQGTLWCCGTGRRRVGFAMRRGGLSWHFRDRRPIECYRAMGGVGNCTEVTIKFRYRQDVDCQLLARLIAELLGQSED